MSWVPVNWLEVGILFFQTVKITIADTSDVELTIAFLSRKNGVSIIWYNKLLIWNCWSVIAHRQWILNRVNHISWYKQKIVALHVTFVACWPVYLYCCFHLRRGCGRRELYGMAADRTCIFVCGPCKRLITELCRICALQQALRLRLYLWCGVCTINKSAFNVAVCRLEGKRYVLWIIEMCLLLARNQ